MEPGVSQYASESARIEIPTGILAESNAAKLVYLAIPAGKDAFATQAKIREATGVPQATIASSCNRLVELGAVVMIPNPPKYGAQKGYRRADGFVPGGSR